MKARSVESEEWQDQLAIETYFLVNSSFSNEHSESEFERVFWSFAVETEHLQDGCLHFSMVCQKSLSWEDDDIKIEG